MEWVQSSPGFCFPYLPGLVEFPSGPSVSRPPSRSSPPSQRVTRSESFGVEPRPLPASFLLLVRPGAPFVASCSSMFLFGETNSKNGSGRRSVIHFSWAGPSGRSVLLPLPARQNRDKKHQKKRRRWKSAGWRCHGSRGWR